MALQRDGIVGNTVVEVDFVVVVAAAAVVVVEVRSVFHRNTTTSLR